MSKSLGNLVTIRDFLSQHEADVFRMIVLNSSYRGPLTYNDEVVSQSERALDRLRSAIKPALTSQNVASQEAITALEQQVLSAQEGFVDSMDDDFNTAGALGVLFDLVRGINQARDAGVGPVEMQAAQSVLVDLASVLGLRLDKRSGEVSNAAPFIDLLVELRKELRSQKLWSLSDLVRNRLGELGVTLEDGKEGTTWTWK